MNRRSLSPRIAIAEAFALIALITGLHASGYSQAATDPAWAFTGNLNTARMNHTATLLQDGRVLVVGGVEKIITTPNTTYTFVAPNSAELYDPVTGMWTVTGHLNQPRIKHTATLLPDGRILVAGGGHQKTSEIYDSATGTWTPTGSMTTIRSYHTATLLQNGKVLIVGGVQDGIIAGGDPFGQNSSELYDPATGTWSRTGDLNIARSAHTSTLLNNGKVLVAGGSENGDGELPTAASAELYDPMPGIWTSTGNLNVGRNSHTATLLPNGKVLVAAGGNTTSSELYNPTTAQWTESGTLNSSPFSSLARHTSTLLTDGDVVVVGGSAFNGFASVPIDAADKYDPDSGKWRLTSRIAIPRFNHTTTLLRDGSLLVVGGTADSNNVALATAEFSVATGPVPIGPGFTGSWYDPAQSGHGLFVEVLSDNRFYASWFAFDPGATQQVWFTGVGTYSGNTATITAIQQPTGGRWIPNFDPTQIVRNAWGTLTFAFTDCDHGRVDFGSVAGYGTGSMNLTRLTQPAGLSCP